MAENTIIFMVIIQFVALTTCTLVGLACKAIHRLIGHSIEEIKLQFVGPQFLGPEPSPGVGVPLA